MGDPLLDRGRRVYSQNCSPCHGKDGDGRGAAARTLPKRPRSFISDPFRTALPGQGVPSEEALRRVIRDGLPDSAMPSFSWMEEEDVRAVLAYLRRFFARRPPRL